MSLQNVKRIFSRTKNVLKEKVSMVFNKQQEAEVIPITATDVLRYRYHHGVNLGSIFVLEEWLFPSMFPHPLRGSSELAAVTEYRINYGFEATKARWEAHWTNPITEDEFKWLATEAKVTSIRLPIGYFTLGEVSCMGTPFEELRGIYANAWQKVKDFTAAASRWGIGTLIDFHALQGGANKNEHSGTSTGKARLWNDQNARDNATSALMFIAGQIRCGELQGIVGIQIVNEPLAKARDLFGWYEHVIRRIGKIEDSIPLYIADAWDLETALRWTNKRKIHSKNNPKNPIVIDTHEYWCFDDSDKSLDPQAIIMKVADLFQDLKRYDGEVSERGEAQIIVGEWSCVLDEQSWTHVQPHDRNRLVKRFGLAQSKKWQEEAGGAYFWTYKNELMPEGEWGFETQVRKGNISPPEHLTLSSQEVLNRIQSAQIQRKSRSEKALRKHGSYWNEKCTGKVYDLTHYSDGWEAGWDDSLAFFRMRTNGDLGSAIQNVGGDKIGCLEIWIKKRLLESGVPKGDLWQLEQGFRRGVADFYKCCDI